MTTQTCEFLVWILVAFSIIICALEIISVILYGRLMATRKMLNDFQSSGIKKIAINPTTNETTSKITNTYARQILGNPSLKGDNLRAAVNKIPVTIPKTTKEIKAISLFIIRVYKWLCNLSTIVEKNLLTGSV